MPWIPGGKTSTQAEAERGTLALVVERQCIVEPPKLGRPVVPLPGKHADGAELVATQSGDYVGLAEGGTQQSGGGDDRWAGLQGFV